MAIFSDFEIFGHFSNVSGIPQSDHYASKSAGYCLYIMLWDYNIIYMPMGSPQSEKLQLQEIQLRRPLVQTRHFQSPDDGERHSRQISLRCRPHYGPGVVIGVVALDGVVSIHSSQHMNPPVY